MFLSTVNLKLYQFSVGFDKDVAQHPFYGVPSCIFSFTDVHRSSRVSGFWHISPFMQMTFTWRVFVVMMRSFSSLSSTLGWCLIAFVSLDSKSMMPSQVLFGLERAPSTRNTEPSFSNNHALAPCLYFLLQLVQDWYPLLLRPWLKICPTSKLLSQWDFYKKMSLRATKLNKWHDSLPTCKKSPTYPWNIPQTLNHLFMKEILSYWYFLVVPVVCSKGHLWRCAPLLTTCKYALTLMSARAVQQIALHWVDLIHICSLAWLHAVAVSMALSYNPYKWPLNGLNGLVSGIITGRGPSCSVGLTDH